MVQVTDEDVDEMIAVLKLVGVYSHWPDDMIRNEVKEKMREGKVPCFQQMRWVKREEAA